MNVVSALQSPKAALTSAAATITSGQMTVMDFIPDVIGMVATSLGAVLTLILCRYWIVKIETAKLALKKERLEFKALSAQQNQK